MPLPQSPGWSFRYAPEVPGGGVVMAVHEGQKASVRLYAHAKPPATLQDVIAARRKQLGAIFQVDDIDTVIEHVIKNDYVQFQGHPAWQWQGVTEAVAVAGEEPQKVMFMLLTLEREQLRLGLRTAMGRETAKLAAGRQDPMARDHDRHRIAPHGFADVARAFPVR